MEIAKLLPETKPASAPPTPRAAACHTCQDTGYLRIDYPLGHPMFGRITPCPDCGSVKGHEYAPDEYGLLPADRCLSWSDFFEIDKTLIQARDAVIACLERGWGWVYLYGGYGSSKTHILKTAVALSLQAAKMAVYSRMSDIFDTIRAAYDGNNPQGEAIKRLQWFRNLNILAIDEIEKTSETPFVAERRFQLLDHRYEVAVRQNWGITLIAGNVPPGSLDGAIASRIMDNRFAVVKLTVKDIRHIMGTF